MKKSQKTQPIGMAGGRAVKSASLMLLLLSVVSTPSKALDGPSSRLSDWLFDHPTAGDSYPLGLSWNSQSELPVQAEQRERLLKQLDALQGEEHIDRQRLQSLRSWIASLPVTGRVPVPSQDAYWLQVNPTRNPELRPGDGVVLPVRPRTVTVLGVSGEPCRVEHEALHRLVDYVNACAVDQMAGADWVWVAQPDGRVQRFGVALWNRTPEDEPAPGAWIWAPSRQEEWPDEVSARLIQFLATQGPAPDGLDGQQRVLAGAGADPMSGAARGMRLTSNDWGGVGVMQTPSARMREAGDLAVHISRVHPYTHVNVFLQPFDWMEAGFRYTSITNRFYGPAIAGGQAYKDKSIDLKLRLMEESAYSPELALGWRDLVGTGLFSGEYLVASKRTGDFDWSLGLGWGYVGSRGNLRNPLGLLSKNMDVRPAVAVGQGGNFSAKSYFRGPASLFGGVQYHTQWEPLVLKLEYDGNGYLNEPLGSVLKQSSPFNFGAVYRAADGVDISLGFERGNTAMLGLTLSTPLSKFYQPKLNDPPPVAVNRVRPQGAPDWAATSAELSRQTDWPVSRIERDGRDLRVTMDGADAGYWRQRLDKAVSVLHRDAPADIDSFTVAYRNRGVEMAEHRVNRDAWADQQTKLQPPAEQRDPVMAHAPGVGGDRSDRLYENSRSPFENSFGGGLNASMGGPDSFMLYQLFASDKAELRLGEGAWLQGEARLGVLDNYNKFKYTAASNLPRVRTYVREFMTGSKFTVPNLQLTKIGNVGEDNFYSVYGGLLEEMYAGVGGEWLYRPFESPVAVGVDINAVKMRGFKQDFALQNYRTTTGHVSLYWDTGWNNIQANLSAGRYLAKDTGVSVELTRYFENGVTMGAGLTKTNLSATQFGEGSFDKWIRVTIPFDALFTRSSSADARFTWQPLIRDGGAKLHRAVQLYDLTRTRDARTLKYKPGALPNDMLAPEDRHEAWTPPPRGIEAYVSKEPKVSLEQWRAEDQPYKWRLEEALYRQQFRDIELAVDAEQLSVKCSNDYMYPVSRAVGRAVRTALLSAPEDIKHIRITLTARSGFAGSEPVPVATYDFSDLDALRRYLDGDASAIAGTVKVSYFKAGAEEADPLAELADKTPVPEEHSVLDDAAKPIARVENDLAHAYQYAHNIDWLSSVAIGGGMVLASSLLDNSANRYVAGHAQSGVLKNVNALGNTLVPMVTAAGAAMAALSNDPRLSKVGYSSIEAGGTALALTYGSKFVVGRSRPATGQGSSSFHAFAGSAANGNDSFPSGHTTVVWSMVTPFAEAYDAPWLYGVAAMTNLARVGSNKHWVSDTVAGSVLGYGIGKIMWESSKSHSRYYPSVGVNGSELTLTWETP